MSRRWFLLALAVATVATVLAGTSQRAMAFNFFNRQMGQAYFSGQFVGGSFVFEPSPDLPYNGLAPDWDTKPMTIESFIAEYRRRLNSPTDYNRGRAAASIAMMMGINADDPRFNGPNAQRWVNGVTWAQANFPAWENLIRDYDRRGKVNFNDLYNDLDPIDWLGARDSRTGQRLPDVRPLQLRERFVNEKSVIFYNEDGTRTVILKKCANLPGMEPLDVPPPPPAGDAQISCQRITGRATQAARPNVSLPIRITFSSGSAPLTASTNPADGTFSVNMPAGVSQSMTPVRVTVYAGTPDREMQIASQQIGPCLDPTPDCGPMSVEPSPLDPNMPYQVTASVRYASAEAASAVRAAPGTRFFVTIRGPGVDTRLDNVVPITQTGVMLIATTPQQPPVGQAGNYIVGWGISGPFGSINCGGAVPGNPGPPVFTVANRPYFRVNGGDLKAGMPMAADGSGCAIAAQPKASVVGWNRGVSGGYAGAGSQFAAIVGSRDGRLQEFATGQGSSLAPSGLAFANNADGDVRANAGLYGGRFNGGDCTPDYFRNAGVVLPGDRTLSGLPGFPSAGSIPNGYRSVHYIDGDLYVDSDIRFSGAYAGATAIPTFTVVVRGNILIGPNVTQLDGVFIAQPSLANTGKGVIYTCATDAAPPFAVPALSTSLHGTCNRPLTVSGVLSGRQVWLLRTAGSLSSGPAETINYVPEHWLSSLHGSTGYRLDDYDSISNLPPVL